MRLAYGVLGAALIAGSWSGGVWGQAASGGAASNATQSSAKPEAPLSERTFYLKNTSAGDANEIVSALRNILDPRVKVVLVPSQSAVVVSATGEQLALTQKLLEEIDRPKKLYRLTYTFAESDNGKRVGVQHFAIVVLSGKRATLKEGSKVPIVTGSYSEGEKGSGAGVQTQFTYLDLGYNLDATLEDGDNGTRLITKVEQSSVAPEPSGFGAQDPIIRQTVLEGSSIMTPGKPLVLESIDVPGSTRHLEVEVLMELVK